MTGTKTLILGGVRSGKSRMAEQLAVVSRLPVTYIATGRPGDEEMRRRIEAHRARRPAGWEVIEEAVSLAAALRSCQGHCVIVDCLTLWLTNLLTGDDSDGLVRERSALLDIFPVLEGDVILVSNETNMGVVSPEELTRRFCDEAGNLHQVLAQMSNRVILTVAGLPHILKGESI